MADGVAMTTFLGIDGDSIDHCRGQYKTIAETIAGTIAGDSIHQFETIAGTIAGDSIHQFA
jgi:hypothetical protein